MRSVYDDMGWLKIKRALDARTLMEEYALGIIRGDVPEWISRSESQLSDDQARVLEMMRESKRYCRKWLLSHGVKTWMYTKGEQDEQNGE